MGKYFAEDAKRVNNEYFDPLGPTSIGKKGRAFFTPTQAPQMRGDIFSILSQYRPQAQAGAADVAAAAKQGANNAGWNTAQGLAADQLAGRYLNGSPAFNASVQAMRDAAQNEAADSSANIRSGFQRNGLGFSTANQQAETAARAAATAQANQTEAGMRGANYANERAIQQQSPQMLAAATSTPLELQQLGNEAMYSPLSREAQLIAGLSQGQAVKPDMMEQESISDRVMRHIGQL